MTLNQRGPPTGNAPGQDFQVNKKILGVTGATVAVAAVAGGAIVAQTHRGSGPSEQQLAVGRPVSTQAAAPALRMNVPTPKRVTLVVGGKKTSVTTTAATVAAVLQQQHVVVGKLDTVTPRTTTHVSTTMVVTVNRVHQTRQIVKTPIPHTSVTVRDASLPQGSTKVTQQGSDGVVTTTWLVTWTNNVQTARTRLTAATIPAVARQVHVGTKPAAPASSSSSSTSQGSTAGLNLANAAMWDRIAACESSGNWAINTGNGYYGGLQFDLSTWASVGGTAFAARPDLASRAQQITAANRLYAERGLSPWQCAYAA